jgi:hypothetical protein
MTHFFRGRILARAAALLPIAGALTGCSLFESQYADVKCPTVGIIGELSAVSRFDGHGTGFPNLAYRASLGDLKTECKVNDEGAHMTITIATLAEIGPVATSRSAEFPYFIAITDPDDKILTKRVFSNAIDFKGSQARAGARDVDTETIPMPEPADAPKYHVIIGFQLTEEELAFNRSQLKTN